MEYPSDNELCRVIEWDQEKFGIGIRQIDEQHKMLLDIMARMGKLLNVAIHREQEGSYHAAKKSLQGGPFRRGYDPTLQRISPFGLLLDELVGYCAKQLTTEDHFLETYGYQHRAAHFAEHAVFVTEVTRCHKMAEDYQVEVEDAKRLMYFLRGWITEHVPQADRKYAPLLAEKGVGG